MAAHVHYTIEKEDGKFWVYAVARTRRECLGWRGSQQLAEREVAVYEKFAAESRQYNPKCKLCGSVR